MALSIVINLRYKELTTLEDRSNQTITSNRIVTKSHYLKINRCLMGFEKTPNWLAKDAL